MTYHSKRTSRLQKKASSKTTEDNTEENTTEETEVHPDIEQEERSRAEAESACWYVPWLGKIPQDQPEVIFRLVGKNLNSAFTKEVWDRKNFRQMSAAWNMGHSGRRLLRDWSRLEKDSPEEAPWLLVSHTQYLDWRPPRRGGGIFNRQRLLKGGTIFTWDITIERYEGKCHLDGPSSSVTQGAVFVAPGDHNMVRVWASTGKSLSRGNFRQWATGQHQLGDESVVLQGCVVEKCCESNSFRIMIRWYRRDGRVHPIAKSRYQSNPAVLTAWHCEKTWGLHQAREYDK